MNASSTLAGKTVLVTGASSGLGRSFAVAVGAAGANVVIGARRSDKLQETAELVADTSGRPPCAIELDVTDANSIKVGFDAAEEQFGVVDVIVNNAGVSRLGFLLKLSEEDWDAVIDTNLKGVWMVAREGARRLRSSGQSGSIINIASILAFGTGKMLGSYMASKAGVVQLTHAMALEWAQFGIRVNAIAPGYFSTEMNEDFLDTPKGKELIANIPAGRAGRIEELHGALLLFASDASSYMNGSVIAVDGGHLCHSL